MKKYFFLFAVLFNILLAHPVFAVNVFFESKQLGNTRTQVDVFLDTQSETINAVQGEVDYDMNQTDVSAVYTGNSIINFWIQNPKKTPAGVIEFSGMTPGGFSGQREFLFSVIFQAKENVLDTKIFTQNIAVFKNDGKGTRVDVDPSEFSFALFNSLKSTSSLSISVPETDTIPPESFTPILSHDENMFEGKWFVSFSTQDKGQGIHSYEVCEKGYSCERAESPFVLKNQTQERDMVSVKAIDIAGNVQVGTIQNLVSLNTSFDKKYMKWVFFILGIFGILVLLFVVLKKYAGKK